ncbi:MAG: hypothetical protein K6U11_13640 [bacterium]|nr:hypothetical protein [bacterium]
MVGRSAKKQFQPEGDLLPATLWLIPCLIIPLIILLFGWPKDNSCWAQAADQSKQAAEADSSAKVSEAEFRTWLNQEIAALFNRKDKSSRRLPSPASGSRPPFFPRCATPLVQAARQHPELLDEQNRFILYRPTDFTYQDNYYGPVKVFVYRTSDGHCRIHYTEDNSRGDAVVGSDGLALTIPPFVLAVAKALEATWAKVVENLGYSPPALVSGSSIQFDCYIMGISYYGYSTLDPDDHPYMVIANNYEALTDLPPNQDPEGSALGAMRVTVAHEFFHAIQFGYTEWEDQWWEENTAVWIEDEVFDHINDYLHYLGEPYDDLNGNGRWDSGEPYYNSLGKLAGRFDREIWGWFDWPFLPLEATSSTYKRAKYQEYGGVIWVKYLAEKYGPNIVRSIFERGKRIRQQGKSATALSLIKAELASRQSSLGEELEEFKVKVLTRDFEEGDSYPQVWHADCFKEYPALFKSDDLYDSSRGGSIGTLRHLSAHYLRFQAPDEDAVGSLRLKFTRTYGTAPLSCPLVLTAGSGLTERVDLTLNPNTCSGEITLPGFGKEAEFQTVEAIVVNTADYTIGDLASFTLEANFTPAASFSKISFLPGMNLFSPPFLDGESLDSHQFLLHYFSADSVHSLSAYDPESGQWITNTLIKSSEKSSEGTQQGTPNSKACSVSGPSFPLSPGGIYILNMKTPRTITLPAFISQGSSRAQLFRQGLNFFSLPLRTAQTQGLPESAFELLDELGEDSSAIVKREQISGRWLSAYHFFQKPAGRNFGISGGETSIVNMVREKIWRK